MGLENQLFERYQPLVRRLCQKHLGRFKSDSSIGIDDLQSVVNLALWRECTEHGERLAAMNGRGAAFVTTLIGRELIDFHRKAFGRGGGFIQPVELTDIMMATMPNPEPEDDPSEARIADLVALAEKHLTGRHLVVAKMRLAGANFVEIGKKLGFSESRGSQIWTQNVLPVLRGEKVAPKRVYVQKQEVKVVTNQNQAIVGCIAELEKRRDDITTAIDVLRGLLGDAPRAAVQPRILPRGRVGRGPLLSTRVVLEILANSGQPLHITDINQFVRAKGIIVSGQTVRNKLEQLHAAGHAYEADACAYLATEAGKKFLGGPTGESNG